MGKKELQKRTNWQNSCGICAQKAEHNFYEVFERAFENSEFKLHKKPKHLKDLYNKVNLPFKLLNKIFNPDIDFEKAHWGVSPDFAIENTRMHKILFGEIKRQDGWVEGKDPSAGRGNAHERLCKLFTPGLQKAYREAGGITNPEILPFWVVFEGDITRDPKRVREITFWFDKYKDNFFLWQPDMSDEELLEHFNLKLKSYLE